MVPYQPKFKDKNPAETIKQIIRSQPPAYIAIPYKISVQSDCLEMMVTEERSSSPVPLPLAPSYTATVSKVICYKNIGEVILHESNVWYVEIYDRLGNWMYTVYCYNEIDAKRFIDALYTMKECAFHHIESQ